MTLELVSNLTEILAVEERVHRELRKVLSEERDRMLELDAEALYELAMRKEVLAEEGGLAQDARLQASRDLAQLLGLPEKGVTLGQLCSALDEAPPPMCNGAMPLSEARSRLLAVVSAVSELSEANQRLGGERLADVQTTLQLLGRLAPTATRDSAGRGGHLVRRSA